jgi:hypothetical protein
MTKRPNKRKDVKLAQRGIATQVLRDDHPKPWTRAELERALSDLDPQTVRDALDRMHEAGAVVIVGELVEASRCARHLDALLLIGI